MKRTTRMIYVEEKSIETSEERGAATTTAQNVTSAASQVRHAARPVLGMKVGKNQGHQGPGRTLKDLRKRPDLPSIISQWHCCAAAEDGNKNSFRASSVKCHSLICSRRFVKKW